MSAATPGASDARLDVAPLVGRAAAATSRAIAKGRR